MDRKEPAVRLDHGPRHDDALGVGEQAVQVSAADAGVQPRAAGKTVDGSRFHRRPFRRGGAEPADDRRPPTQVSGGRAQVVRRGGRRPGAVRRAVPERRRPAVRRPARGYQSQQVPGRPER